MNEEQFEIDRWLFSGSGSIFISLMCMTTATYLTNVFFQLMTGFVAQH